MTSPRAGRLTTNVWRIGLLALFAGAWEGATRGGLIAPFWVSSPSLVIADLWRALTGADVYRHIGVTLYEAFLGFVTGAVVGILGGFALARWERLAQVLDPYVTALNSLPRVALAPLFILWFGIGIESKIALVAVTVFFIVYFSALAGVRALDAKLVQMAEVAGANERQIARHIVFPGAVPYIFTGLRIAMPYSIGGAVIAELISANRGLGYLVQLGAMNFDTVGVFAALVTVTCIVFIGNGLVNAAERRLLRRRPPSDVMLQAGT